MKSPTKLLLLACLLASLPLCAAYPAPGGDPVMPVYEGRYFAGAGDTRYLELLDMCARVFWPDPEYQNLSMLYSPTWNGFVEGPTWGAWWIQNSYGPTYCELPFLIEPYTTFLQNAQDLWFSQMGDGLRKGANDWVAPDGRLCDAAAPGWIIYRQGDGRTDIHDWAVEFTAAGIVMQAELLLISRDVEAIHHYLPLLRRSADFLESRRDPANNLFLAGPAGNLLAPSYAGYHRPDDTYGMAYLAGLSITTIAALDRLIELEKLAGDPDRVATCERRRDLAEGELRLYVNGQLVASSPAAHVNLTTPVPWPKVGAFYQRLAKEGLADTYEAAHARLLLDYVEVMHQRETARGWRSCASAARIASCRRQELCGCR